MEDDRRSLPRRHKTADERSRSTVRQVEINPRPELRDKPTLQQLNCFKYNDDSGAQQQQHRIYIIDNVAAHWKRLGLTLNISNYHLDNIEHNHRNQVEDCCRAMLTHWLQGTSGPVTWEGLVEAMEDARCGELAQQINRVLSAHLTDPTHSTPHLTDPTHSTPHTLPDALATFQQHLKDLYTEQYPHYSKPQFTVNRPQQIVNLVLVHKERNEPDKLQQQCLLYQLHGNIDLIRQKKTPLTKDQIGILASSGGTAHRVLIEGAPGIGKTTFLWQLCHQWAVDELLQKWDLVILVQLREETARTAQSLSDLLYHPDDAITKDVCRIIEQREGERVMFLFDGYDELSNDQRTESFFLNMLRSQRILRKATVVVSSRPFATKMLPHQFKDKLDQHIEIVGFSEKDIETYLTSSCQDNPDLLKDLKSYISSQPFVSSVLYSPLHCSIVTELYRQYWQRGEKGFAPSTMTQLYDALLLNLLQRHLDLDTTLSWEELPSDVLHQLNQLAELAARGIEERQYIFQHSDVPIGSTLGLLHTVKHLHDIRPNQPTSYCFTHLTVQEYLAALHWSKLPPQQLTELLQRQDLFPIQQYVKEEEEEGKVESLRMTHWPVLVFLAGLCSTSISPELIAPWTAASSSDDDSSTTSSSPDDEPIYCTLSVCRLLLETQL